MEALSRPRIHSSFPTHISRTQSNFPKTLAPFQIKDLESMSLGFSITRTSGIFCEKGSTGWDVGRDWDCLRSGFNIPDPFTPANKFLGIEEESKEVEGREFISDELVGKREEEEEEEEEAEEMLVLVEEEVIGRESLIVSKRGGGIGASVKRSF